MRHTLLQYTLTATSAGHPQLVFCSTVLHNVSNNNSNNNNNNKFIIVVVVLIIICL